MKSLFVLMLVAFIAGCATAPLEPTYPTFIIKSPAQGQVLNGSEVMLFVDNVENVILVTPSDSVVPGQGHFHIFLDNSNEQIGPRLVYYYYNLTPGKHTIRIELRRSDHSQFEPAAIKSVSFTAV